MPGRIGLALRSAFVSIPLILGLLSCGSDTIEFPDAPGLVLSKTVLDFGENATQATFEVRNDGAGTLTWSASSSDAFVTDIDPAAGTGNQTITVTISRTGLAEGVHVGSVDVTSNLGDASVSVQVTVAALPPTLVVSPDTLRLGGIRTEDQFQITNAGTGNLNWSASTGAPFIAKISPTSGPNDAVVSVTVDRTGLAIGKYFAVITVTSEGGNEQVVVEMDVGPFEIPLVATLDTAGDGEHLVLVDPLAYIADGSFGRLTIVDVVDPTSPAQLDQINLPNGVAAAVDVSGTHAYVANGSAGLVVVDVSNPSAAVQRGTADTPGLARDAVFDGNHVYVADRSFGLQVVDVTNVQSPTIVGAFPFCGGDAFGIAIQGSHVFVVGGFNSGSLDVFNVADPTNPTLLGFEGYSVPGQRVHADGNQLYIASGNFFSSFLEIMNIFNPANPNPLVSVDTENLVAGSGQRARDVTVVGNFAYVANGNALLIFDVTNAGLPVFTAFHDLGGIEEALGVTAQGDFVYVVGRVGLHVLDQSLLFP